MGAYMNKVIAAITVSLMLVGCMTVRQVDLDAWVGQPVVALEKHPFFITVPLVKTVASDGTEIRNYVNGRNVSACSGGGSIFATTVDLATYNKFSNCMSGFAACNNIFYINKGRVTQFVPVGTGGARCYTDERIQPNFRSATNII